MLYELIKLWIFEDGIIYTSLLKWKIIYDRLKSQVKRHQERYFEKNKKQYIYRVLLTIEISNLRSFNDLLELVSGIFIYRYTNMKDNLT